MFLPWMNRSDRRRWQSARTMDDLTRLTAAWWGGTVRSLPGHRAGHRPHPTLAEHADLLAAANRAGFLIPGGAQAGLHGRELQQKAAVQGFATDPGLIRRLVDASENAGLEIVLNDLHDADRGPGDGITVTRSRHGENSFGHALGLADLQDLWRGLPHALHTVAPALQITLAAPQFGPSRLLWGVLAEAITPPPEVQCRKCGCTTQEICADGCGGVQDQNDGRCTACIDPSIVIDWTSVDDSPRHCVLCDAPFYAAGAYCTEACEIADSPDEDEDDRASEDEFPNPAPARAAQSNSGGPDAPWTSHPPF